MIGLKFTAQGAITQFFKNRLKLGFDQQYVYKKPICRFKYTNECNAFTEWQQKKSKLYEFNLKHDNIVHDCVN